jgi:phosphoribosylanthranilate isomerase
MATIRTKVCCIRSAAEAELDIRHGADAIGLVGEMPSGPGVIGNDLARAIAATIPEGIDTFLLSSRESADGLADHVRFCGTTTLQIVRHLDTQEYPRLRRALPDITLVQVLHVEDRTALGLVDEYEEFADAFLLDSGRPAAEVIEFGGTGRTHDWQISAQIVRRSSIPVYLAGGLNPGNIARAIDTVAPYGVDLC